MNHSHTHSDIVLVGGGVMSATLAILLKELQPPLTIALFESLEGVAAESSNAWNNAGTGHAALCELNYTPQRDDGSINITKALEINEAFEVSRQFWAYLVERGVIESPGAFIHAVPHMSFVHGAANVSAGFVFLGAGGAALPLLQKSGFPEGRGFGGFPR